MEVGKWVFKFVFFLYDIAKQVWSGINFEFKILAQSENISLSVLQNFGGQKYLEYSLADYNNVLIIVLFFNSIKNKK